MENLESLIGKKFEEVEDEIEMYIAEQEKEDDIIIKDSENAGYDKIAYANTKNSNCYCFKLDEEGTIINIF